MSEIPTRGTGDEGGDRGDAIDDTDDPLELLLALEGDAFDAPDAPPLAARPRPAPAEPVVVELPPDAIEDEPAPAFSIDELSARPTRRPRAAPVELGPPLPAMPITGRIGRVTPVHRRPRHPSTTSGAPIPTAYGGGLLEGLPLPPRDEAQPPPPAVRPAGPTEDRPTQPPLPARDVSARPLDARDGESAAPPRSQQTRAAPERTRDESEEDAIPVLPALALGLLGVVVAGVIGAGLWFWMNRPTAISSNPRSTLSPVEVRESPPPEPAPSPAPPVEEPASEEPDAATEPEVAAPPPAAPKTTRTKPPATVVVTTPAEDPWATDAPASPPVSPEESKRALKEAQRAADAQRAAEAKAAAKAEKAAKKADDPPAEDDPWGGGQ